MQDKIIPNEKWKFDSSVVEVFDDMLERSIPSYHEMRELVKKIGFEYAKINTAIVDIGCSKGEAIAPFISRFGDELQYFLYDVSEPMLNACKERFGTGEEIHIEKFDIRNGIPKTKASVILSVLTLQFTPIEYRHKIIKSIYDSLTPDGVFIIVEKVLGNTSEIDELFVKQYYEMKSDNAYTQEQILSKRKSLEGVLVPITAKWNEDLLRETGFKQTDCFWRHLNFAGWIARK